jgi:hypothetical protein
MAEFLPIPSSPVKGASGGFLPPSQPCRITHGPNISLYPQAAPRGPLPVSNGRRVETVTFRSLRRYAPVAQERASAAHRRRSQSPARTS